ncbi:MAG TPA: gephyrin-like molybdotransferase Glp [Gaiellaceae bacterium]|nr:gephyrin-like molybdotransferase Glp [Gaiellaceae bacterium]
MAALITIEEAQRLVLARARAAEAEPVPLGAAAGRWAAEAARAAVDLPPFPSSAMDGFAVRAADTPGRLTVAESVAAGRPAARALAAGEAFAISTGGVVPHGADAVVPVEHVARDANTIEVAEGVRVGAHVREPGRDAVAGDVVVEAGERITPARLGALGAAGVAELRCARRPRAVVLGTGTELRRPGAALAPGEVYEANGVMLAAGLRAAGAEVEVLDPVADDEDAHRAALARGLDADLLVTSGGVSVGPHDLVRRVLGELGVEEVFWRVAVKPGKPVGFGVRGASFWFGLPGNPVSSLVGLELFVLPAVRALQGARDPLPRYAVARLGAPLARNPARDELVRADVRWDDGELVAHPLSGQESHMIVRAARANALVHVARGEGALDAGTTVRYLPLG